MWDTWSSWFNARVAPPTAHASVTAAGGAEKQKTKEPPPPPRTPTPPPPPRTPTPPPPRTPTPPPPPPPLFEEEWRKIPWGTRNEDLQFVKEYQPPEKVRRLRILIHGPQGAGKSSFINSVDSTLRGRIATRAQADTATGESFTTQFTSYKIKNTETGTFYPFVFTDIMGLERDDRTFDVDNIKLALKGHIKEGYTFNPNAEVTESDPSYNQTPSLDDQVHVLVCVVNAATVAILDDRAIKKLRAVRLAAQGKRRGIVQVAILTHIEEACPEVKGDIKNVYRSQHLKEQMDKLSETLGIPLNCIFPVRNYYCEIETDDNMDTLILSAMRKIIQYGEDYLDDITDEENSSNQNTNLWVWFILIMGMIMSSILGILFANNN